jgi:putative transposase
VLIEFNGEADHVHVLLSLPPHIAISEFVNALKTNTSRVLRRDHLAHLEKFYTASVL